MKQLFSIFLIAVLTVAGCMKDPTGFSEDDDILDDDILIDYPSRIMPLPEDDPRRAALRAAADTHREAGLASVTGEHYEGGHWLGSFATYLVTGKGR